MILTSILIGGQEFVTKTLLANASIVDSLSDRLGTCTFTVLGKPSDVASSLIPGVVVEIQQTGGARVFYGRIVTISAVAVTVTLGVGGVGGAEFGATEFNTILAGLAGTAGGTGYTKYTITCRNYADLLNGVIVSTAITYTGQTDHFIISDLFGTYLPSMSLTGVDTTATIPTITFDNITLRQALENLIALTGATFYVDTQVVLQYHLPTSTAAPFGISETPDNVTTFAPLYQPTYLWDFSSGANQVKVIGALGAGGTPITATRNDTASQGAYGIVSQVIVDRSITSTAQAQARGDVQLANYSRPLQTGTFFTYRDGLAIDQLVTLNLPSMNLTGAFLIQKITATWPASNITKYQVEFGQYMPDLARALRKALTAPAQSPSTPYAIPAPNSIVPGSFASTLQGVGIVNPRPALPNSNFPAGSVVVDMSDFKLYRSTGSTWIAAVPTTDLTGQISAGQIAANAVTAGTIAAGAVIAGTISVGAIRATDFAFAAGAIQTADIANLAVTDAKINTLTASKLTAGTINASVITVTNLNASNITVGTMAADRITSGSMALAGGIFSISGGSVDILTANWSINALGAGSFYSLYSAHDVAGQSLSIWATSWGIGSSGNGNFYTLSIQGSSFVDASGNVAGNSFKVGGNQVVSNRHTGWTSPTGTPQRSGFATSTATLADVAQTLMALITDLTTHGLVGA